MKLHKTTAAVSALVFACAVGPAFAGANDWSGHSDMDNNPNAAASANSAVGHETRVAYSAAGVLRQEQAEPQPRQIPQALIEGARCIAVFPSVVTVSAVVGGTHGNGIVSCRGDSGRWATSAPAYFNLSSGSIGAQAGVKTADMVMLFMTKNSVHQLTDGNFKLGADIGVAAGPVGTHAEVHTAPAPILAYRVNEEGAYIGADIKGTVISVDHSANAKLYGPTKSVSDLLFKRNKVPARIKIFNETLAQFAPASQAQWMHVSER